MMFDFSANNFSRLSFFTFCVPLLACKLAVDKKEIKIFPLRNSVLDFMCRSDLSCACMRHFPAVAFSHCYVSRARSGYATPKNALPRGPLYSRALNTNITVLANESNN